MIVVLACVALAYFYRDPVIIVAILCFLLAFFLLVGAAIGGDISDPIVWVIVGVLVLLGLSSVAAARRRIARRLRDRS